MDQVPNWADDYEKKFQKGPVSFATKIFVTIALISLVGGIIFGINKIFFATMNNAGQVVSKELSPTALNNKYNWFKDAHAQLDAKRATITELQGKIKRISDANIGTSRNQWARTDLQSVNQWDTERDGVIASYNSLAAEYNAEMSKWHTGFVNAGKLPAGGNGEIPRNVAPYMSSGN